MNFRDLRIMTLWKCRYLEIDVQQDRLSFGQVQDAGIAGAGKFCSAHQNNQPNHFVYVFFLLQTLSIRHFAFLQQNRTKSRLIIEIDRAIAIHESRMWVDF
jgi:hypothetical protein